MSLKVIPIISLVPFRTFRGPLFPKPVTGQELFLAVSYSKPALAARINDYDESKILSKVGKIQIYHT